MVRVKAPATTANLGPGYDCLGLALDVWNTIEVELLDGGDPVVEVTGEGAGELATGRDNLVYRSMEFLFQDAGQEMPALRIRCENAIPLARGMGSSAAAIAANAPASGWRMSMVRSTPLGMTLREPGWILKVPTVARPSGA